MEDGCMETSRPFPAEPCGFCARAVLVQWPRLLFSLSWKSNGIKKTKQTYFSFFFFLPPLYIVISESIAWVSPLLCVFTHLLPYDAPSPSEKPWGHCPLRLPCCCLEKKKLFLFSSDLGGCTDRLTLPGDDVVYLLPTHTNSTAADGGSPVSAWDLCCCWWGSNMPRS